MNGDLAVEASGLAKSYRDVPVLAGVDLKPRRSTPGVYALATLAAGSWALTHRDA
jgi:hypothetical protein